MLRSTHRHGLRQLIGGLIIATLVGILLALFALTSSVLGSAATLCSAPPVTSGGAAKKIDTTGGCDNPNAPATNPATGFISIGMPSGVKSATFVDAFQSLPTTKPQKFYEGTYVATFSSCTGGSMSNRTYTIGSGGDYPKTPPAASATIAVSANAKKGTVSCRYQIAYTPSEPGQPPVGVSVKNEVFVTFSNGQQTQAATASVKPFGPLSTPSPSPSGSPSPSPSGSPSPSPSGSPSPSPSGSPSPSPSGSVSPTATAAPTASVSPSTPHLAGTGSSPIPLILLGLVFVTAGCLVGSKGRLFASGR